MGPLSRSSTTLVATPREMERLRGCSVAVLFGGTSAEREVSLVSGPAVVEALEEAREAHGLGAVTGIEVDDRGRWCLGGEAFAPEVALARMPRETLFFLGLHGGAGEDGTLQGFLDLTGRRYTGSGLTASALCMDKGATRSLCEQAGLRLAPGRVLPRARWRLERGSCLLEALEATEGDAVVKPSQGGSSVLTRHVHGEQELDAALAEVFECCEEALVESWTYGLEATVGIVGNRGGKLRKLPVVEIRPKAGRFFDYAEKYGDDGATETCPPRELSEEAVTALSDAASTAYRTMGCDGYARVDFIVPEGGGDPVLLELNTLPGFTPRSLLPQAAAVAGVGFAELCAELCALALAKEPR